MFEAFFCNADSSEFYDVQISVFEAVFFRYLRSKFLLDYHHSLNQYSKKEQYGFYCGLRTFALDFLLGWRAKSILFCMI